MPKSKFHFEKVSFDEYVKAYLDVRTDKNIEQLRKDYDDIKLPQRATSGSAGYDFFAPYLIRVDEDGSHIIPTGIRWVCEDPNLVLLMFPRSGLGFNYKLQLYNTIGVVDADYYKSKNEGHIKAKFDAKSCCSISRGKAMMQGVVVQFFTGEDDIEVTAERDGGFGSTDKEVKE